MRWKAATGVALLVFVVIFVFRVYPTSPETLELKVESLSGVVTVHAQRWVGEDDIPFARVPSDVDVVMAPDVSADEILAVFDALAGDISDGDVGGVLISVDGTPTMTLSIAGDGLDRRAMTEDFVAALHDDSIRGYERAEGPDDGGDIIIELAPTGFDEIVAVAERYWSEGFSYVSVSSGDLRLSWDAPNADHAVELARTGFVQDLPPRFQLKGAVVSGRRAIFLVVPERQVAELREYVGSAPRASAVGRVYVRVTMPDFT